MKLFYVYQLESNGIPFYIGKGTKTETYDRIEYHKNYWYKNNNKKLTNKIKKLGGLFNSVILFESINEKECLDLEKNIIKNIGLKNLCNLTEGGEGISGFHHSLNTKNKISKSKIGVKFSDEVKKKITDNKIGSYYTLNEDNKIYIKKLFLSGDSIHNISKNTGFSYSVIRNYLNNENLYIKNNHKPSVNQYDLQGNLIKEWNNISEVCVSLGYLKKNGDIQSCCNGRQKTAFGYIWKYKNNLPPKQIFIPIYQFNSNGDVLNIFKSNKELLLWCRNNIFKINPNTTTYNIIKETKNRQYKSQGLYYSINNKLVK